MGENPPIVQAPACVLRRRLSELARHVEDIYGRCKNPHWPPNPEIPNPTPIFVQQFLALTRGMRQMAKTLNGCCRLDVLNSNGFESRAREMERSIARPIPETVAAQESS